jgi:hypothetical protein
MHGPINVKSPNNISKWQVGFNSAFKGLMASGSKKETQIYFSFLSKVLAKVPPLSSPTGPLWRVMLVYKVFCISLKDLIKFV